MQVEIQEQDMSSDEDEEEQQTAALITSKPSAEGDVEELVNQPLARLRDTSRSRLQRMGALYSNADALSSPIHRTEAQFHADDEDNVDRVSRSPRRGKQRLGKLAALADTINQWEDDTAHHDVHRPLLDAVPPPKPDLPSRPPRGDVVDATSNKTKQLKWDPKVLSSLEAQGFQRRDSSTIKHTYDYAKQEESTAPTVATTTATAAATTKPPLPEKSIAVSQVAKTFSAAASAPAPTAKSVPAPAAQVKAGLVSGRAAIFESKANNGQAPAAQRNQKDPCELSLKERMKLFETGNAKAMLPKAPIGTAPSINQIRAAAVAEEQPKGKCCLSNVWEAIQITWLDFAAHPVAVTSQQNQAAKAQPKPESKLRDKVAALVASAQSSAESRIKDIDRQRQEDMQIIANRFNKQKELLTIAAPVAPPPAPPVSSKVVRPMPPPPPPPMTLTSSKRRSRKQLPTKQSQQKSSKVHCSPSLFAAGDVIDEESKRARKSHDRLYPALSDLDSSGDNCCATATASINDDTEEELERCADKCYSCLLFLLCIE